MTEQSVTTKAQLLAAIDPAWSRLNSALGRWSEQEMTTLRDEHGWTVKDHLIHVAAWERSIVFFLQGKPREDGLGVSSAVYVHGNEDGINAVIYQQHKDLPLVEALAQLRAVHHELALLLQPLTDEDLRKPYRHYLPDEPGEGDGPPAINVVYGNTAHHFLEHLRWIEALATT